MPGGLSKVLLQHSTLLAGAERRAPRSRAVQQLDVQDRRMRRVLSSQPSPHCIGTCVTLRTALGDKTRPPVATSRRESGSGAQAQMKPGRCDEGAAAAAGHPAFPHVTSNVH